MKIFLVAFCLLLSAVQLTYAQGTVRGKITDNNGETLIGVSIYLKSNPSKGTTTDLDGNYSIKIPDSLPQILVISYISYKTIEEKILLHNGQVVVRNFALESSSQEIKAADVTGKAIKAKDYYLESIKKKSAVSIDYISSETIKKTGDNNITSAVSRVTGVSTNNGGFITVRGVGDRYVKSAINGLQIPTLDPFTNNIKLDIFPSSLVDNVMITKTASPDLPGDWAGAFLSVETKDFPDELVVNVETTFGYNTQSTFKDVTTSQRSATDWLGFDNSLRKHDHNTYVQAIIDPTQYQEYVALGLGNYFSSIGVNENTPWNETYDKLGLVQLGLLGMAQINDPDAYFQAKELYASGTYSSQAFSTINSAAAASGKSFPSNWNTEQRKAPMNFSQSFSIGNQVQLFNRPLGFITGFRYGSGTVYDPNSTANRAGVVSDGSGNYISSVTSSQNQQLSVEANGWNALVNMAYKLNPNNSISMLFMPNVAGVNKVRSAVDSRDPVNNIVTKSQFYEQRRQLVYQLKTAHFLPVPKLKIEFSASYTDGESSAPDFKNLQYAHDPVSNSYQIGPTTLEGIHRYYRYLSDKLFDSQLGVEFPLDKQTNLVRKLKLGGGFQSLNRKSDQFDYAVNAGAVSYPMLNGDLNYYFNLNHFGISNYQDASGNTFSTMDFYYLESGSAANHTFGNSYISSGYAMSDYAINPFVRIAGGLRIEHIYTYTDVVKFDSLGLPVNDPRRDYSSGFPAANPGKLNQTDFLPSLNLIFKLREDDNHQSNIRLGYSLTTARPSIRELSDVAVYDYEFRSFVFGNSELKTVSINNFDLRYENYFVSGNYSVSLFYKKFKNHIELVKSAGYSWQNVDQSYVAGLELEGRKKIGKNFEVAANVTLADSKTKFVRTRMEIDGGIKNYIPVDTLSRTMFGQAPYIVNTMLNYTADSIGLTLTLSYNIQGKRLVISSDNKEVPDIYEMPRNLIDFKINKTLGAHFSISLTIRDILNAPVISSYDYESESDLDYDNYTFGTNFVLGVMYKL